jgi:hypothetical protein
MGTEKDDDIQKLPSDAKEAKGSGKNLYAPVNE